MDGTLCVWIAWLRSVLCHPPDVGQLLLFLFLFEDALSCQCIEGQGMAQLVNILPSMRQSLSPVTGTAKPEHGGPCL